MIFLVLKLYEMRVNITIYILFLNYVYIKLHILLSAYDLIFL